MDAVLDNCIDLIIESQERNQLMVFQPGGSTRPMDIIFDDFDDDPQGGATITLSVYGDLDDPFEYYNILGDNNEDLGRN